jgi:penicillin amidase
LAAWLDEPVNDPELEAPLLFDQWYLALARRVFEPTLGPERTQALLGNSYLLNHALDRLIAAGSNSPWWSGHRTDVLLGKAFEDVLKTRSAAGPRGRWGEAHRLVFRHEMSGAVPGLSALMDRGPYPWGGGNPTVGRARYRYDRPFDATGGATVRLVIEMSEPMRIGAIMPGGQSGHPASAHYDDQLPVWMARGLDDIPTVPEAAGDVVTTLTP